MTTELKEKQGTQDVQGILLQSFVDYIQRIVKYCSTTTI